MSISDSNEPKSAIPGWGRGSTTIADLEDLASDIRPSWEVGLDTASELGGASAGFVNDPVAFTAAPDPQSSGITPSILFGAADLAALAFGPSTPISADKPFAAPQGPSEPVAFSAPAPAQYTSPAQPLPPTHGDVSPQSAALPPTHSAATHQAVPTPSVRPAYAPPAQQFSAAPTARSPVAATADTTDGFVIPQKKSNLPLIFSAIAAVVISGVGTVWALSGSAPSTSPTLSTAPTTASAPASPPASPAEVPTAPSAPLAVAPVAEPVIAAPVAPVAPPVVTQPASPIAQAPVAEPRAPRPERRQPAVAPHVDTLPRVSTVATTTPTRPTRPQASSTGRTAGFVANDPYATAPSRPAARPRPRAAGFASDSPY
ncbi:MAG: hypothetical protein Q8Q09_14955 [Deltaproteobacteria bacterium]|nr:hypothetical protein [Deltaproteobacteria bacterium]